MFESIFWGALLRFCEAVLQASPFIFTGLCITGLLHRLMGQALTRKVFGSNSISSQFQSWIIGMLLPGCSLGCIPVVKQLRKSGISVGTIFAFALASPLFDPLSMLYGLTLSKPLTIVAFAFGSLIVVTLTGSIFDHLFPNTELQVEEPPPTPHGIRRLLSIVVVMAREAVSGTALLIGLGLLGNSLLSIIIPYGALQRTMSHENPFSPLLMTSVSIPAYATPMIVMSQLGSMFQHGNSIGAAFILLIFGAGMNLGLLAWMLIYYGWRRTLVWFGLMIGIVLVLSYGIERPLYPRDIDAADHTHAFDRYCRPFDSSIRPSLGYMGEVGRRLRMETQLHEIVGFGLLALLISLGLGLRRLDQSWSIDDWLNRPVAALQQSGLPRSVPAWDIVVPGPVLGVVGFLGIIAMSIAGCFAYYPTVSETIEELNIAKTETLSAALSRNAEAAEHWIPVSQSWNRRLQVGVYLRTWKLSAYLRMKSKVFQDRLEELDHMLENEDPPEKIHSQIILVSRAYERLVTAYRDSDE